MPHTSEDDRSPLILIVSERSGGNLLLNMISAHPELHGPIPSHMFRLMSMNRERFGDFYVDDNWHAFLDVTLQFAHHIAEPWTAPSTVNSISDAVSERTIESALWEIYEAERKQHNAKFMLLKENEVYRFLPFMLLKFPAARYVWQVRDPRDMLTSFKRSTLFTKLVSDPISHWEYDQQLALNAYPFMERGKQIHFQKYEDLLEDPATVLAKLCEFIGVEYDDNMLHHHESDLSISRAGTSDLRKNVASRLMKDNKRKYLEELSKDEIVAVESRVGDLMESLGYVLEYPGEKSKDEQLAARQRIILDDQSTSLEDRQTRASRVGTIRKMLRRPLGPIGR